MPFSCMPTRLGNGCLSLSRLVDFRLRHSFKPLIGLGVLDKCFAGGTGWLLSGIGRGTLGSWLGWLVGLLGGSFVWWGGGCPRLGGSGGLSLVGFLMVLVTFYVAVWHARGAPPPLREGVSWFVFFNSLALAGWAFCLKKKKKKKYRPCLYIESKPFDCYLQRFIFLLQK